MKRNLLTIGKKSTKVLGVACVAAGAVALGSVIASGSAVYAMGQSFKKSSKRVMNVIKEEIAETKAVLAAEKKVAEAGEDAVEVVAEEAFVEEDIVIEAEAAEADAAEAVAEEAAVEETTEA